MANKDLLIVDDEVLVCESLKEMLTLEGYNAGRGPGRRRRPGENPADHYQLILSDMRMPGLNGIELLKELKGRAPDTAIIFITGHGHIEGAVEAIKLGAYDYITKPIDDLRLKLSIQHALEQKKLLASYNSLKQRLKPWDLQEDMVFGDRKMHQLLELVHTIADTMATVLITGESGTGKSMLAKYIHEHSSRREGPFVKISCGSLSETLLESELFGHVRGSFTGAIRDKKGKFEEAHGGTIFLDDINCASPNLQIKFLRVLQEKVIERVGGNVPIAGGREDNHRHQHFPAGRGGQPEVPGRPLLPDQRGVPHHSAFKGPAQRHRTPGPHFITQFNQVHHREIKGISQERPAGLPESAGRATSGSWKTSSKGRSS